jgi:23S rRNA (uracil1939-C5)-methyltransferase
VSEAVLTIESVGVRGDGVADHAGERIFVPFTAPGDVVRVRLGERRGEGRSGTLLARLSEGARAAPRCAHFGTCGGCALQHLSDAAYAEAKTAWLAAALRQRGVTAETMYPLRRLAPGTRRRARWAIRRPRQAGAPVEAGFHARASHRVVDMRECAVLHPALMGLLGPLRDLAMLLLPPGGAGAATATLADTGIDLLLDLAVPPQRAALEAMAAFAHARDLARLAWRLGDEPPTPAAQRRPVRASFAGVAVDLPYDGFLQASVEADHAIAAPVLEWVGTAERVADLFSGVGTFTFPLAARAAVHAVEGDAAALAALRTAADRAALAGHITCERRDLEARPLLPAELGRFDAVVFDPPRAGAAAQSRALAASRVPRIVAVSCNPASFARDARTLCDGGYRLATVQPIDSFVWSPHLELVARFERAGS